MMRLIDAKAFCELLESRISTFTKALIKNPNDNGIVIAIGVLLGVKDLLKDAPTIEAKPVVHAHWDEVSGGRIICTNCGNYPLYDYFGRLKLSDCCPSCGAIMDEK